ncbi:MAG: hypothetical protein IJY14_02535 [Acholeplasmatales bacterium]|nr:hypothetical protein [Acholeplasmatales bacterium]
MKKLLILIFLSFLFTIKPGYIHAVDSANSDYTTFSEITMSTGKLLQNFTDEEYKEYYSHLKEPDFKTRVQIYEVNHLVSATYISNTLYSIENRGNTDIEYDLSIEIEKNNKVSCISSLDTSGSIGGSISKIKGELETKLAIKIDKESTKSEKTVEQLKLVVEAHSRAIVYLCGNLVISNGVYALSMYGVIYEQSGYEVVTMMNQYVRIEKVAI